MIRVVYTSDTKVIVTVLAVTDGITVYPPTCTVLEDTEANILDEAEAAGIENVQPIIDYLDSL